MVSLAKHREGPLDLLACDSANFLCELIAVADPESHAPSVSHSTARSAREATGPWP